MHFILFLTHIAQCVKKFWTKRLNLRQKQGESLTL